jgi:1,2-diacylglycerol 3-alpha-glucosyltransferase
LAAAEPISAELSEGHGFPRSRILHVCLSNYYSDNHLYQENELIRQHVADGQEVLVVASTEVIGADGGYDYVAPDDYIGPEGARVIRLPYPGWLPPKLARKLRMHPNVYRTLADFRPHVILFHGSAGWELRTVARYVADHRNVTLYIDTHADHNNSARTWLSREILHKYYYGPILRSALPQAESLLCTTVETMAFARSLYDVPQAKLELFPLGGHPVPDCAYAERRRRGRAAYGVGPDQILIVQSGKQTRRKKLLQSLRALRTIADPRLRLVVAGVIEEDIAEEFAALRAADDRVTEAGWVNSEALTDLLCAADVYLQPGTQSVTMQHSLCCRCAVIVDDVPAHTALIATMDGASPATPTCRRSCHPLPPPTSRGWARPHTASPWTSSTIASWHGASIAAARPPHRSGRSGRPRGI